MFTKCATNVVCVTEQRCVSIFFTCVWSVGKPLIFHAQNPEISGFQLRIHIITKPDQMKRRESKTEIFVDD